MATILTVTGADFSANSVGFIAPVADGLVGWWYLGGTEAETKRDRAGIANATLGGSPTINAGYASFGGYSSGQWLQTAVTETAAFTMLCVARSTEAAHSGTDLPMFVSNYGSDAGNGGASIGASLYVASGTVPAGVVRLGGGENSNGTIQGHISANISVAAATSWNFYAGRLESTSSDITQALNARKVYDKTTAQTGTATSRPRVPHSVNKMRIGACFYSGFSGSCDVAFAAFYSRALTDDEIETIYQAVKARMGAVNSITI